MLPLMVGSDNLDWLGLWWLAKVNLHELINTQLDLSTGTSKV